MCLVPGVQVLFANEFAEYCKKQREEEKCEFYSNVKTKASKVSTKAKFVMDKIKKMGPSHNEEVIEICAEHNLCPYEISTLIAAKAKVIVADYYYIFNPKIRDLFFNKTQKILEKSVVIVDEAQNMTKDELTTVLTRFGEDSRYIIVGDSLQSDINGKSGFNKIKEVFNSDECRDKGIFTYNFTDEDVVRSKILKFIVSRLSGV